MVEISEAEVQARFSIPELKPMNNYYIVEEDGLYHYFPVKVDAASETPNLIRFDKRPSLLIGGYVGFHKKLYEVTTEDILRGIIRKSREVNKRENNGEHATPAFPTGDLSDNEQLSSGNSSEVEVDGSANAAWEEQTSTLLDLVSSQEGGEWEITDTP